MKKDLEIILVTYNRREHLQNTFNQLFADNSPVKNLNITILDNKSTDGTSDLISDYQQRFPNIKHIVHNRNIGGNANIARAFEVASNKYFWILCDDDEYDWTHWNQVERAMDENYDAIVVANYVNPQDNLAKLVQQLTFVPSAIYKSENLTDTVMANAEFNLSNMFSQLAIGCHLINEDKKIYICENWIVNMVPHGGEETYTRGFGDEKHPIMGNMLWPVGFVNSVQMIKDKEKRAFIIDNASLNGSWFNHYYIFFDTNRLFGNSSFKNVCDIFCGMNMRQKIAFSLIGLYYLFTNKILYIQNDGEKINLRIFGKLKTHIRYSLFKERVFGVWVEKERIRIKIFGKIKTNINFKRKKTAEAE